MPSIFARLKCWNAMSVSMLASVSGATLPTPSLRRAGRRSARKNQPIRTAAAASDDSQLDAEELVQTGAVVSAHGLRGEVRIMPFTDFVEERFFAPNTQYLEDEAQGRGVGGEYNKAPGAVSKIRIVSGREVTSKGRVECLIKIKGVNDRNAADALIGRRLFVSSTDRSQLREEQNGDGDDEFYASELEGCEVVMKEDGKHVGVVIDIYRGAGEHDLLKISVPPLPSSDEEANEEKSATNKGPSEHVFVPFVKEFVPVVDMERGVLEITPPPGLLDLRQKAKPKKRPKARGPPPPRKKE